MKFLPVVLLTASLVLTLHAQEPASGPAQNVRWKEDITLDRGRYEGGSRKIEVSSKKVDVHAASIEGAHFENLGGVAWSITDSSVRKSSLWCKLKDSVKATGSAFEDTEFKKFGRAAAHNWTSHWVFENCVFAQKFTPPEISTRDYSIRADHCTFHDIQMPDVAVVDDASGELQTENFRFQNCRFVGCEIPEALLVSTINCVFEECRFTSKRENWDKAGRPILVTAYVIGRAATPQSYANGKLKVAFQGAPAPENGATVKYTYTDHHLVLASAPTQGDWLAIGKIDSQTPGAATPAPSTPVAAKPVSPNPMAPPETQTTTAELVKTYRNSLVFVTGTNGAGSGFLAKYATGNFLFTNAHVAAGVRGAAFKALDGTEVKVGAASCAVGHDVFLMQATTKGQPFEIMKDVDQNAAIGDEIVVLGNAEGQGVINTITGKIVGIGPQLVEVDAPFQPGNSGSPIIHLKSGKVIGLATYAVIRKFDPSTKEPVKEPVIRRFGYRLDSIKSWQPVNWQTFFAQATEMEAIEKLTTDLVSFLNDLGGQKGLHLGAHNNPAIKSRLDAWVEARSKRLSGRDAAMADQSLLSFLKVACQNDIAAARPHITFDYFQRQLADQQQERDEISKVFSEVIQNLRK